MSLLDDMAAAVRIVNGCRYVVRSLLCPSCGSRVQLAEGTLWCVGDGIPIADGGRDTCYWKGSKLFELAPPAAREGEEK